MPQRIQLSRTKGYRKPVGAIVVSRPWKWGNPFRVGETVTKLNPLFPYLARTLPGSEDPSTWGRWSFDAVTAYDPHAVVEAHGWWLIEQPELMLSLHELRGRDLACWCPLLDADGRPAPCHADTLIALANEEVSTDARHE